jgi:hypothetical protein
MKLHRATKSHHPTGFATASPPHPPSLTTVRRLLVVFKMVWTSRLMSRRIVRQNRKKQLRMTLHLLLRLLKMVLMFHMLNQWSAQENRKKQLRMTLHRLLTFCMTASSCHSASLSSLPGTRLDRFQTLFKIKWGHSLLSLRGRDKA